MARRSSSIGRAKPARRRCRRCGTSKVLASQHLRRGDDLHPMPASRRKEQLFNTGRSKRWPTGFKCEAADAEYCNPREDTCISRQLSVSRRDVEHARLADKEGRIARQAAPRRAARRVEDARATARGLHSRRYRVARPARRAAAASMTFRRRLTARERLQWHLADPSSVIGQVTPRALAARR